jgi:hypothetical protein
MTTKENILFLMDDSETKENIFDINDLDINLDIDIEENILSDENQRLSHIINYEINYTVKELLTICDYYNITKTQKLSKSNKEEIIHALVSFEINPTNEAIVCKRQNMWFYMNELKTDKFMKKYIILWN